MAGNYAAIIRKNLNRLYNGDLDERAQAMQAVCRGRGLEFRAFGADCRIEAGQILLNDQVESGPPGIIISLYALHAIAWDFQPVPFKAFKELPGSMPYAGAFANRSELALVPAADRMHAKRASIIDQLDGENAPADLGGDFSFVIRPLPKVALCYLCYLADEDFPAAVTCLFSHNAPLFLPTDALADVGEYSARAILNIC